VGPAGGSLRLRAFFSVADAFDSAQQGERRNRGGQENRGTSNSESI
jgi:hypothetical protein